MFFQMIRGISSPSGSAIGLATLIFGMRGSAARPGLGDAPSAPGGADADRRRAGKAGTLALAAVRASRVTRGRKMSSSPLPNLPPQGGKVGKGGSALQPSALRGDQGRGGV